MHIMHNQTKKYLFQAIVWQAELNEEIEDINRAKEEIVRNSDVDSDDDTSSRVLGGRADLPTARQMGTGGGKRVSKEEFNM